MLDIFIVGNGALYYFKGTGLGDKIIFWDCKEVHNYRSTKFGSPPDRFADLHKYSALKTQTNVQFTG